MALMIAGLLVLAAAGLLAIWAARRPAVPDFPPDGNRWLDAFSVEKYRPMLRLFDPQDREWLENQSGCASRRARKLARQRARIFAQYLEQAALDGRRLHAAAWQAAVPAEEDVRDLAAFVSRQPWLLDLFLLRARLRLAFCRWGVGTVDPAPVFEALEALARSAKLLAAHSRQSVV